MSSSSALWLLLLWGKLKARARYLMLFYHSFLSRVRLSWIKLRVPLMSTKLRRDAHSISYISFSLLTKTSKTDIE